MRKIEFRGYSKRFERWLHGFLVTDNVIREFGILDGGHEVLYIGQYTGLKDKNGKKIFEDDIVKDNYDDKIYSIVFDEDCSQMILSGEFEDYSFYNISPSRIEVIGNIYDNPELLEG